jgi:hypothetical protein
MALNAGEVETILRLRDDLSAQLATARQTLQNFHPELAKVGEVAQGVQDKTTSLSGFVDQLGSKFGVSTGSISQFLGPLGEVSAVAAGVTLAVVGVALEVFHLGEAAVQSGDKLENLSLKLNIGAVQADQLTFATGVAGGNIDQLANAMFMMSRRLEESGSAGDKAREALQGVGIDAKAFMDIPLDRQILAVSDAFRETTPNAKEVMDLFGRQGKEVLPALLKPMSELVEKYGELHGRTEEQIKAAADEALAEREVHAEWEKLWTDLGTLFLPVISQVNEAMKSGIDWIKQQGDAITFYSNAVKMGAELTGIWHEAEVKMPTVIGDAKIALDHYTVSLKDRIAVSPTLAQAMLTEQRATKDLDTQITDGIAGRKKAQKAAEDMARAELDLQEEVNRVTFGVVLDINSKLLPALSLVPPKIDKMSVAIGDWGAIAVPVLKHTQQLLLDNAGRVDLFGNEIATNLAPHLDILRGKTQAVQDAEAGAIKVTNDWGLSWKQVGDTVSGNLVQMLSGVESFSQGFSKIWHSLLTDLLGSFVNNFVKGILNSLTGAKGGVTSSFGTMFSGLNSVLSSASSSIGSFVSNAMSQIAGVAGAVAGVMGMIQNASTARNALSGAMAGASIGGMIGGPIGAGIGAGIGAAAGAIEGLLLGDEEQRVVNPERAAWFSQHGNLETVNPDVLNATGSLSLVQAVFNARTDADFKRATAAISSQVPGYVLGGEVPGPVGAVDSQLARVTPGERILTVDQNRAYKAGDSASVGGGRTVAMLDAIHGLLLNQPGMIAMAVRDAVLLAR